MRNVYLSFLGLGQKNRDTGKSQYHPTVYSLGGKSAALTEFVQVAEIELLGANRFDVILIAATDTSYSTHFSQLKSQLAALGAEATLIRLGEDMSAEGQWRWFEEVLKHIEPNDQLTVDLTHGFRSIPIIFSTAINFLQKAKNITLNAAYYGAYDLKKDEDDCVPITDMKDFYIINEWADGVGRLVFDADARKLAEAAEKTASFQAGELNDKEVILSLDALTEVIRNVDANNVHNRAATALKLIQKKRTQASLTGKILLDLVIDKFVSLTTDEPMSGKYDEAYFQIQLEIIRMLLEHRLFMQAYTVMREMIGSLGMIKVKKAKVNNNEGRRKRRYAEVFINMIQFSEGDWKFGSMAAQRENRMPDKQDAPWDQMIPYYRELEAVGIVDVLRSFAKDLSDFRNGFDHAWTSKAKAYENIGEKGSKFFEKLEETFQLMRDNNFFEL